MLTEVTDNKRGNSTITKVDGFIKSITGNLQENKTTRGLKHIVEWNDVSVDSISSKEII